MFNKDFWRFINISLFIFVQQSTVGTSQKSNKMTSVPTVTIDELSKGVETSNPPARQVLSGILNDYMDLMFGKSTPYTTGKQVLPSETTLQDVEKALNEPTTEKKFKKMFEVIVDVYNSGDLTPRSQNDGTWDPKLKPVLVMVRGNNSK